MTIPSDFEWLPQLDLSNWDPEGRAFVERLREVLADLDPGLLDEHVQLASRAPGGIQDREHLLDPAVFSLVCYGVPGVEALRRLAVGGSPKVSRDAMQALMNCAQGEATAVQSRISLAHRYMSKDAFEHVWERIAQQCASSEVREAADVGLTRCIKAIVANDASGFDVGMLLMGSALPGTAHSIVSRVFREVAHSALRLTEDICDEFEALVQQDLSEADYQRFLETHPALVDPLASEVVGRQAMAEMWKTDFVIRRLDNQYVFVEIEKPSDAPIDRYPAPRASLAHALGQVLNWFIWVEDNIAYAKTHGFPDIHSPRGVVVIGRDKEMSPEQRRHFDALSDALGPRLQLFTYDDLLRNARNVVRNMVSRR